MKVSTSILLSVALIAFAVVLGCSTSSSSAKIDRPNEMLPQELMYTTVGVDQLLPVYAKFTGAQLDVSDDVRAFQGIIVFKDSYPPMTRAEALDVLDTALLKAGVVVTHRGPKLAIFRLKQDQNGKTNEAR